MGTWEGTGLARGTGQQEHTASDVGEGWVSPARAAPRTCGQRGDSGRVSQPGSQPQYHCLVHPLSGENYFTGGFQKNTSQQVEGTSQCP